MTSVKEKERLERLQGTLDNLLEGCQILGFDWTYLYLNDSAATHARRPKEELIGRTIIELYPGVEVTEMFAALRRCMIERVPCEIENLFSYPDGSQAWFELRIQPVPEGIFVLSIDVTQRKQAEEEVHRLNAELERRVEERTAELRVANQELDNFAHTVSHDLRAPLRGMIGFARALTEDYGDRLDAEGRKYLNYIVTTGDRMNELIEGLLTLSRVTRAELQKDLVDVSSMAERLLGEMARIEPEREVKWEVEPGLTAHGDARLIDVVLQNLLGNAWKYTAGKADATIRLFLQQQGEERYFTVADNGAGFDMEYAENLFEPFQRLHRQEDFPGIGIGLATVNRIVQRHGGVLEADAAPGRGAMFRFTLPQAGPSEE